MKLASRKMGKGSKKDGIRRSKHKNGVTEEDTCSMWIVATWIAMAWMTISDTAANYVDDGAMARWTT